MTDNVNHPDHYGGVDNPYEAIKVIEAWGADFCIGNCLKYLCRAGAKGDEIEDLEKAAWYLQRRIKQLKGQLIKHKPVSNPYRLHSNTGETMKSVIAALSALIALAPVSIKAQSVFWTPATAPFAGTMVPISKNTTTALQMIGTYMYNWQAGIPAIYNASAFQQIDTVTLTYCGAPTPYGQQVFATNTITVPTGAQNPTWQNSTAHGPKGIIDTLTLNNIAPIPGTTLQGLVHVYDPGKSVAWSVCIVRVAGHWITHVWNNANQDILFNGTSSTTISVPR